VLANALTSPNNGNYEEELKNEMIENQKVNPMRSNLEEDQELNTKQ
jgi:hypothetical protein